MASDSDRPTSAIYEELPCDKVSDERQATIGRKESFLSDGDYVTMFRDARTLTYIGEVKLGFSVCGGNTFGVFVQAVDDESNAGRAALKSGDKILKINGSLVRGKTKEEIVLIVRKMCGQKVELVVVQDRAG